MRQNLWGRTKMKARVVSRLGLALGLAVGAAIALGSVAFAQSVPEQFIVTGKSAEKIQDFTTINLATAERIAETCEQTRSAWPKAKTRIRKPIRTI